MLQVVHRIFRTVKKANLGECAVYVLSDKQPLLASSLTDQTQHKLYNFHVLNWNLLRFHKKRLRGTQPVRLATHSSCAQYWLPSRRKPVQLFWTQFVSVQKHDCPVCRHINTTSLCALTSSQILQYCFVLHSALENSFMCVQDPFCHGWKKKIIPKPSSAMNLRMEPIFRCLLLSWPCWASGGL